MKSLNSAGFALVLLLPIVMTLLYGGVHQPVLALFYVAVAVLIVIWSVESWKSRVLSLSRSQLQLPLFCIAAYALLQTIPFGSAADPSGLGAVPRMISADPFATRLAALQFLACAAFLAFAIIHVNSAKRLRRLAAVLTIFGFVYGFFAVLQSVLSPEAIYGIYKPNAARPFGSFVNRNDFAALMVLLVSLPLGMLFSGAVEKDKRLLYLIAIAIMGTSILLSQSRGGSVAFICEIILLIIFTSKARGTKNLLLKLGLSTVLVAAVIGGAVFVGGETSLGRLSDKDVALESQTEQTSRAHIWASTIKMIGGNMPLGVGLGAYPAAYPQYDSGSGSQRVEQAHNDYLQLISDGGVIAGVLGVWFLVLVIRQGRESLGARNALRRSLAAGALAGMIAILLHSLFDFVLHITAVALMFLLLVSVLIACARSYADDVEETVSPPSNKPGMVMPHRRASARTAV